MIGKGSKIAPELRLPHGSTNTHVFRITLANQMEAAAGAWLSQLVPYQGGEQMQEFSAYLLPMTNVIEITVQLKPHASVSMPFTLVVMHEHRRFGQPSGPANRR